ncbi:hypothetical protein [Liquorilactobacillus satsumensis]|nr:hypothetical protein [Liquorilactobacillus satsumensis]
MKRTSNRISFWTKLSLLLSLGQLLLAISKELGERRKRKGH